MKMKKIAMSAFALLLCLTLSFSVFAADDVDIDVGEPDSSVTVITIPNMAGQYKTEGRTSVINDKLYLDYTASSFEFNANCKGDVRVTFSITALNLSQSWDGLYFTVIVDGVRQDQDRNNFHIATEGDVTLTLATGLTDGLHTFQIFRQSEIPFGVAAVKSITIDGTLAAKPADKTMYMEFIGDSITAGYGNLTTSATTITAANTATYQDGTQTYAFFTASALNADLSVIANSGICAYPNPGTTNMPDIYPYTRFIRDNTTLYDFTRQPKIVVINLGTNDMGKYLTAGKTLADVKAGFASFLAMVRSKNPNASIVWAHDMMVSTADDLISQVIAEAGGAANKYYHVSLTKNTAGGAAHPTVAGQQAAANDLVSFINSTVLQLSPQTLTVSQMAGQYKTEGRTSIIGGNLSLDYTASGLEFNANCQGDVSVTFNATSLQTDVGGGIYFSVWVDGTELSRSAGFVSATGDTTLKIATGLPQGAHNFKIYRSTEIERATVAFKSVTLQGNLDTKPADKNLFIEFVGDSITTGYGDVYNASYGAAPSAPINQDGTKTYAFLTAKNLDADFSMVAQQGIGASVGYQAHNTIMAYPYTRYIKDTSTQWNFTKQPDIVVINLGTNDINTYISKGKTLADVKTGFATLLTLVRLKNPNAKIVWVHGMMTTGADTLISQVISEAGGASSGYFEKGLSMNKNGGNGHPDLTGHLTASNELTSYLQSTLLTVTTPTVTATGYTAGTWTKDDVTFTLSGATYLDGIAKYQYSTDGTTWNDITSTNGTITKDGNNNVTQVLFPVTSGVNTYSFRAVSSDNQNSAATAGVSVKIDKVVPVIAVSSGSYTTGTWTKDDVTFTFSNTATNSSGVSYQYSANGTTWNNITGSALTFTTDTEVEYQFRAVSGADVQSVATTGIQILIRKTAPVNATVTVNPANPDTGAYYKTAPTITITEPTVSSIATTTYYKLWAGAAEPIADPDGTVFTGTNQPVITVDGDYTLKVWTVDEAGNMSTDLIKFIKVNANATGILPGDINGNGEVDLVDVTILSRYVAGWSNLTYVPSALDVSGNNEVDLLDITILSRYVAGWNVVIH